MLPVVCSLGFAMTLGAASVCPALFLLRCAEGRVVFNCTPILSYGFEHSIKW